jgi:hypothetical protein
MPQRNFIVVNCDQRSEEWHLARCGRLTGSRAADAMATIKSGEAAARRDLRMQIVCERLTGFPQEDGYVNAVMQRGIDMEPAALAAYEAITGTLALTTGFLSHTSLLAGCSLDGHVGDYETVVSLKCPKSATHLRYLRDGVFPSEHRPQMLHELWISGAKFYDFLSFDGRMPAGLQTFWVRVVRNDEQVAEYERKALAFLAECDTETQAIRTLANVKAQLQAAVA